MTVPKPDVVGGAEAAEILGVPGAIVSGWVGRDRLPPRAAPAVKGTPVWHRAQIEALKPQFELDGSLVFDDAAEVEQLDLLGLGDVADLLGVHKSAVGRWRREGKFPEPCLDRRAPGKKWKPGDGLRATPLWWREQIVEFMRERAA